MEKAAATIEEYIAKFPEDIRRHLELLCALIRESAPEAAEKISWGMATFVYHGNLVHFSAEKHHAGFHPAPSAIDAFREELAGYRCSKGTVQFPYDQPIPEDLIRRMVRFRVAEQAALAEAKRAGRKAEAAPRPRYPMPEDVSAALSSRELTAAYDARPPYQRNDYIGWITRAKRPETREKRLAQMLEELRAGDAYMGMPYRAKPPKGD